MNTTDRQKQLYEGLTNSQFKSKYKVKKNQPVILHKAKRENDGSFHYCTGSKKCRKRAIRFAVWVTNDGQYLCRRCAKRYRIDWCKSHNIDRKQLKKAKKVILTETERRRRIFAHWRNPELDKLRETPEYKTWRIAVLERDEYTCQHCRKTGGILHAHHIKTFKMNPESRYEINNGITLCKQCHEDLHIANVDRANKKLKDIA